MNSTGLNRIFQTTECPPHSVLRDYVGEQLDADQTHEVEAHLIDCQLCSNVVDSMQTLPDLTFSASEKTILRKLDQQQTQATPFFARKSTRLTALSALAASILLLFVVRIALAPESQWDRIQGMDGVYTESMSTSRAGQLSAGPSDTLSNYDLALKAYGEQKWTDAIALLSTDLSDSANISLSGEAYLRAGAYCQAAAHYAYMFRLGYISNQAIVCYSLALIGMDDIAKAREVLAMYNPDEGTEFGTQISTIRSWPEFSR